MKQIPLCLLLVLLVGCASVKPIPQTEPNASPTLFLLPPAWTPTPARTPTASETLLAATFLGWTTKTKEILSDPAALTAQAKALMHEGDFSRAIQFWDQVLLQDPQNSDAYYQRATCYYDLSDGEKILERYTRYVNLALNDIDRAVSIQADIGDYYSLRQSIYIGILSIMDREVDREYLANIALDNARKANALGTTIEQYPDRIIILDLIFTMQCQEALDQLKPLLAKTSPDDLSRGGLLHIQSQAFACLGQLDNAIGAVDASMFNMENMDFKKWLKSAYLYQSERYTEALSLLNDLIDLTHGGGGERYYLRAAIYFAQGKIELAASDLEIGQVNTWSRYEMFPYVEAQIALKNGDKADAIPLLLYSETTFESFFTPQRWKVQKQLASLGMEPLTPSPSVPYPATPIPS